MSMLKKHVQAKARVAESRLCKIQTVLTEDSLICFSLQGPRFMPLSLKQLNLCEECHRLNRAKEQEGKRNKRRLLGLICAHILCIVGGEHEGEVHGAQNRKEQIRKPSGQIGLA